jgi:hypothetical protein
VALKAGIVAGMLLTQRLVNRGGRYDRAIALVNFAHGGMAFGIAGRNYGIRSDRTAVIAPGIPVVSGPSR